MVLKFINPEYLDSVTGGDMTIIREIADMFRDQSGEIYNEMKSHLARKEYEFLGLLAHKAKSSVAILGMDDLAAMLKTLEYKARQGVESDSYQSLIERFRSDTNSAVIELESLIKNRLNKSDGKY